MTGLDSHSYVVIILFAALMYLVLRRKDPPGPDAVPTWDPYRST